MHNLKPCPFCGGRILQIEANQKHEFPYVWTITFVCECGMVFSKKAYLKEMPPLGYAYRIWNTRMRQTLEDGEPMYSPVIGDVKIPSGGHTKDKEN
jgi:C4-type Zn-finger protein